MKKLYAEQKHTLYEIQKKLNLDCKRLYRYANKSVDIDKMPVDLVLNISYIEKIEPNKLFAKMKEYLKK